MEPAKIIKGQTEDEIWQQITADLTKQDDILEYDAMIEQDGNQILLDIDIDLGGGFEGGYESTMLRAPLHIAQDFRFAVHHQGFIDEIGKFFGMQDVETGYEEFDKEAIIKTNNAEKVKALFTDATVRKVIQSLEDYTFGIIMHHANHGDKAPFLELYINNAITDATELRKIYHSFYTVLTSLDYKGE
jgi:hypothetical protein